MADRSPAPARPAHLSHRRLGAPLLSLLLALGAGQADARVRLGETLPPHPWQSAGREVVVIYTHDCGDLGELWGAVMQSGLPVRAVNVQGKGTPAPAGVTPWRGPDAEGFARQLKVGTFPAVLLVREGRILNAWEGTFQGSGLTPGD